jgi:hypothetical protein
VVVNNVQQGSVSVPTVHDPLQLILIEGDIHPLLVALLLDPHRSRSADHAAIEDLEKLRASEQSLTHLATGGVLDDIRNASVRIEGKVPRQIPRGNDEYPFLAGAVVEGLEGSAAPETVGLVRRRTDGVCRHDSHSCAGLPRKRFRQGYRGA